MCGRVGVRAFGGMTTGIAAMVIAGGLFACVDDDAVPPLVDALDKVGLPASSLDRVPSAGAPTKGASTPAISIVAFADPTDAASRRAVVTLIDWVNDETDVRLAVRPFALAQNPRSDPAVRRWRSLPSETFFQSWRKGEASTATSAADEGQRSASQDAELARRLRVRVSPTVFINGFRLTGTQPVENYKAVAESFRRALADVVGPGHDDIDDQLRAFVRGAPPAPPATGVRRRKVLPEDDDPWRGAREPLVTIQFFADLSCPFSRQTWTTLKAILREHRDVQVRFRHRPVSSNSRARIVARAAIAASIQGQFWPMAELLFRRPEATDADLRRFARRLRLDVSQFEADRRSKPVHDKLDADRRVGDRLGVPGGPVLAINGVRLVGDVPKVRIEDRIAVERTRALEMIDEGVSRARVRIETVRRDSGRFADPAPARPRPFPPGAQHRPAHGKTQGLTVFIDPTCRYSAAVLQRAERASRATGIPLIVRYAPRDVPFARAAAELLAAAQLEPQIDAERLRWALLLDAEEIDGGRLVSETRAMDWSGPTARQRRKARRRVADDLAAARRLGVLAVPALFVRGIPLDPTSNEFELIESLRTVGSPSRIETVKPNTLD